MPKTEPNLKISLQSLPLELQSTCASILNLGKAAGYECLEALKKAKLLNNPEALEAVEALIKKDGSGVYAEKKAEGISFMAKQSPESLISYIKAATKVSGQTYRAAVDELGFDLASVLERAIISIPPLELIPEDKIHREDENEADNLKVRGSLGTVLKREVYRIFDPEKPQQVGFFAWSQATKSLIEAFNPKLHERIEYKEKSKSKKELEEEITRILQTLPEISISDAKENLKKSPTVVYERLGSLLRDLQSAIDAAKGELTQLTEGDALISLSIDKPRIRGESGGQLLGWFERFPGSLPKIIENDLENLKSKFSTESSEERRERIIRLVSFRALHTYIDTETAVHSLIQDLMQYKEEEPDKALEFQGKHETLLHSDSGEMSVSDANRILLDAEPIRKFRKAKNQELLGIYKDEFLEALQYFKPLFIHQTRGWREDSQGSSVPRARLRKTVFGADTLKGGKPVLNYDDWKLIMKGIELEMAYPNERLPEGMPIQDFKTVVEGIIQSYRKVKIFREFLKKNGEDLAPLDGNSAGAPPSGEVTHIDVENYSLNLKIEGFPKNLKLVQTLPYSIDELINRADDLSNRRWGNGIDKKELDLFKAEIRKYELFGMYDENQSILAVLDKIIALRPIESIEFIKNAEAAYSSPFFFPTFPANEIFGSDNKVRWKYIDPEEYKQLKAIAELDEKYPSVDAEATNQASELRQRFKSVQFIWLPLKAKRFDFKKASLEQRLREKDLISLAQYTDSEGLNRSVGEAGDPLRILLGLRSLDNHFIPLSKVLEDTPDFHERLAVVSSPKSGERLKHFDLEAGSSISSAMEIKGHVASLKRNPRPDTYYVGKRLVELVNKAYLGGFFKIQNDELIFTFGKFSSQNAFNVVIENDWYFRQLKSPSKSYPLEVARLAEELLAFREGHKAKEDVLEYAKKVFP